MQDYNNYPYSSRHGGYGGQAGFKDGLNINREYWLIKYPKTTKDMRQTEELDYTMSPLSEYIGSHIYQILGYDVHKTELGIRNGKVVVACKDFCKSDERLYEIRTIKNAANPQLQEMIENQIHEVHNAHFVDLKEMQLHLQYNSILNSIKGVTERFWDMVAIDTYINNNDRNNGNWGIIQCDTREPKLAPIFDNGGSFYGKTPESKIERLLANDERLQQSCLTTMTSFGEVGEDGEMHGISIRDMFNRDIPELEEAILRVVSKIIKHKAEIERMIYDIPAMYNGIEVCSAKRKEYYCKTLEIRLEKVILPAYERCLQKQ